MPRTIVDIPSTQMRQLDARCRMLGISRAEGVRRAVHSFLNVKYGVEQEGFGLWSDDSPAASERGRSAQGKSP